MPPSIASVICILVMAYLFVSDRQKSSDGVSLALWVPWVWMLFAVRSAARWLNPEATIQDAEALLEGSLVNRVVVLVLTLVGVIVLCRRRLRWGVVIRKNRWIFLFLFLGLVSLGWSDFPFVSFKRLYKAVGNVIMVLIVLTEERPDRAIGWILRRLSYILLPVSLLYIKYYPELGRSYHVTGTQMFTGVASQKNGLGQLCLILGVYYGWDLLIATDGRMGDEARLSPTVYGTVIVLIIWLFYLSRSATSLLCIMIALGVLLVSRLPAVVEKPQRVLVLLALFVLGALFLEATVSLSELIIVGLLNRDLTLTTRVPMWYSLLEMSENPLVGSGFESFWLGERLSAIWSRFGRLNQAHNGYLETYLNLGLVGLSVLMTAILSGLSTVARRLTVDHRLGILKLVIIVVALIYNWSEAMFHGVNNMWILLLFAILDTSGAREWSDATASATHRANFLKPLASDEAFHSS